MRWKDYPDSDNSWLNVAHLENEMEAEDFAELESGITKRIPMPVPAPNKPAAPKKPASATLPTQLTRSKIRIKREITLIDIIFRSIVSYLLH